MHLKGETFMPNQFTKNGGKELRDDKILKALKQAAKDYEDGGISEVRDVLADIVEAIDEFTDKYDG
jgi:hypothetical protein